MEMADEMGDETREMNRDEMKARWRWENGRIGAVDCAVAHREGLAQSAAT
jgi:hypothetical protein